MKVLAGIHQPRYRKAETERPGPGASSASRFQLRRGRQDPFAYMEVTIPNASRVRWWPAPMPSGGRRRWPASWNAASCLRLASHEVLGKVFHLE